MKTKTRSAAARKRPAVTRPPKPAVTRQAPRTTSIDLSDCASAGYQPLSGFKK